MNPFLFISTKRLLLLLTLITAVVLGLDYIWPSTLSMESISMLVFFTLAKVSFSVFKALFTKWQMTREEKRPEGSIYDNIRKFKTTHPKK